MIISAHTLLADGLPPNLMSVLIMLCVAALTTGLVSHQIRACARQDGRV